MILNFIWNGKPAKVKHSAMINKIGNGGLKLQDFEAKIKFLKIEWIKNINGVDYQATWKEHT
jgi:hypothetical protein